MDTCRRGGRTPEVPITGMPCQLVQLPCHLPCHANELLNAALFPHRLRLFLRRSPAVATLVS